METIAHHTCKKEGDEHFVLENAPFLSEWIELPNVPQNVISQRRPFLGTGYYFWDFNIDMAEQWGKKHYNKSYYVIEYELCIDDEELLDLVGNRMHMSYFINLINRLQASGKVIKPDLPNGRISVGKMIEVLKLFDSKEPGLFPFNVFKAVYHDTHTNYEIEQNRFVFVNKDSKVIAYTNLNPRIIICFKAIKRIHLQTKSIVRKG